MIILQLKSTQDENAFDSISAIVKMLDINYRYKIKGHEIHQTKGVMASTTLKERVEMVSRFCTRHELDYLAYHAPIFDRGQNIWEEKWKKKVEESIFTTMAEATKVRKDANIPSKIIVVFHLTNYLHHNELPKTIEEKLDLFELAEHKFLKLAQSQSADECILAVENTYPRNDRNFANAGPFHPQELIRLKRHRIRTALDIAHYQMYANYLEYGTNNPIGDIDRQAYKNAPSWKSCLKILGDSLVLLHISDAKGWTIEGEALPLGNGEIPLVHILRETGFSRTVQGTIEIAGGHLDRGRLQLEAAKWLLKHARDILV